MTRRISLRGPLARLVEGSCNSCHDTTYAIVYELLVGIVSLRFCETCLKKLARQVALVAKRVH